MAANKTFTELEELTTVDKNNDWLAVVDVSDTTASTYGTTKKANVDQFIGEKGDAATVDAGTTTTGDAGTNASVVNVGTTSAAVFNFTIPRGNTGATGATGEAGEDAYVYIAYASDASGTGFTTTFNAALDYIAVKATTTAIVTPQASDFTGLWKNYKGATGAQGIQGEIGLTGAAGADGTDGTDGVNAYVYIAYASDNSGTGFTTTFDANLDYVAIKTTTTEIVTPQASDFTGLWKNYKGATGSQGIQGNPGADGADGLDINWLGVYDAGTGYVVNDAVFYLGSSYICKLASTGNLPTNTTYWDLMAQQGAAGAGSGDVSGPASATDNAIARFDLATGKLIQDSLVTVDDSGSVNIPAGQSYLVNGSPVEGYSDEQAQDAIGTILTDTTTVDFTYTDETPSITADVKDASVANAKLANMATKTYKGRTSATTGVPEDVAVATLKTDLGLVKEDVGLGNVDNTSDATKNSATVTLTNKTIDGDANTISNLTHGAEVDNPTSGVHGVTGSVVGTTDTQTLSAKTLTSPVLDTGVSGTAVLDEDDMVSNSATQLATQQSIKAYVDAQGFTWEGAWATATGYLVNDTVQNDGSGYVCTVAHTSEAANEPGVGASWADKWDLFVEGNDKTMPTGDVVGTTDTQTLTNKTIDGDDNTLSDISPSSIKGGLDGWIPAEETWTYASADAPTFTFTVAADVTAKYSVGMRVKYTQTTVKYGIITAVSAYSGGNTTITIYGGTDYTMTSAAISSNYYSMVKAPQGFPMSPAKWTVEKLDTSRRQQASPSGLTWYNLGTTNSQISIPIGVWEVLFEVQIGASGGGSASEIGVYATLSTANNSEVSKRYTASTYTRYLAHGDGGTAFNSYLSRNFRLELASKTLYYLNGATYAGPAPADLSFYGNENTTVIRATCAYL